MNTFDTTETKNVLPTGPTGFPRILSLAAERAKDEFFLPQKGQRLVRSERREALQALIVAMLRFLDLPTMCLGTPTLNSGFVSINLSTLATAAEISRRRCMRALADLKEAGFVVVINPDKGERAPSYVTRRTLVITKKFFEELRLGPMLQKERHRATERLRRKLGRIGVFQTVYRKTEVT